MKTLLLSVLIILAASPVTAAADKKPYHEHPKYQKILCILSGGTWPACKKL